MTQAICWLAATALVAGTADDPKGSGPLVGGNSSPVLRPPGRVHAPLSGALAGSPLVLRMLGSLFPWQILSPPVSEGTEQRNAADGDPLRPFRAQQAILFQELREEAI